MSQARNSQIQIKLGREGEGEREGEGAWEEEGEEEGEEEEEAEEREGASVPMTEVWKTR